MPESTERDINVTVESLLIRCPDCGHLLSIAAASSAVKANPLPDVGAGASALPDDAKAEGGGLTDNIYTQILNQSSMKVGVCLTLFGLVRVVEGVRNITSIADELLAVTAMVFLVASLLAHFALKGEGKRKRALGKAGDLTFTLALILLAMICGIILFQFL